MSRLSNVHVDQSYLKSFGVPASLIREASSGIDKVPDESRREIYHYVFGKENWLFKWFLSSGRGEGYSVDEIEDLWGQVILKVLKHNPVSLNSTYFEVIFRRTFIDYRRFANKLREQVSLAEERVSVGGVSIKLEDMLAAGENPSFLEQHAFFNEAFEVLSATRSDARETYWKVFIWTYVHHFSIEDIANQLNCTKGAAYGILRGVHNKLRPWLTDQYPTLAADFGEVPHEK